MSRTRPLAVTLLALSLLCMGITAPSVSADTSMDITYSSAYLNLERLGGRNTEDNPAFLIHLCKLFCSCNR